MKKLTYLLLAALFSVAFVGSVVADINHRGSITSATNTSGIYSQLHIDCPDGRRICFLG